MVIFLGKGEGSFEETPLKFLFIDQIKRLLALIGFH